MLDDQTRLRHMRDAALEAVSFLGDLDAGETFAPVPFLL